MDDKCILCDCLNIIAKKWTLLIILEISKSNDCTLQYNVIKKQLPQITSKILSARLKELESNKIIVKKIDNSKVPVNTYYSLTKKGQELLFIIDKIKDWGVKWEKNIHNCMQDKCQKCC